LASFFPHGNPSHQTFVLKEDSGWGNTISVESMGRVASLSLIPSHASSTGAIHIAIVENSISCPADSTRTRIVENQCFGMTFRGRVAHKAESPNRESRIVAAVQRPRFHVASLCDPKCHDIYAS